tara:strand:- start:41 stop:316 length:276 start_codon:yes stop_codon:yes gene_type:complete
MVKIKNILKNTYTDTKDYTTIEPTQKTSIFRTLKNQANRDLVPFEYSERMNSNEIRTYGLSKNKAVQALQKKFTKKGKAAVQDMKLKSIYK